jgi:DNA-binding response OmpR family regulator
MEKKTIAVIEDEEILSKMLIESLSEAGFNVLHASDGEEGLSLIESENIDLILLDILLPKINGIEILKKIRENDKYKDLNIIVLSIVSDINKIADAMEGGVYTYLVKDKTKVDDLVRIVKERLAE